MASGSTCAAEYGSAPDANPALQRRLRSRRCRERCGAAGQDALEMEGDDLAGRSGDQAACRAIEEGGPDGFEVLQGPH
jgi:hypothetical protein